MSSALDPGAGGRTPAQEHKQFEGTRAKPPGGAKICSEQSGQDLRALPLPPANNGIDAVAPGLQKALLVPDYKKISEFDKPRCIAAALRTVLARAAEIQSLGYKVEVSPEVLVLSQKINSKAEWEKAAAGAGIGTLKFDATSSLGESYAAKWRVCGNFAAELEQPNARTVPVRLPRYCIRETQRALMLIDLLTPEKPLLHLSVFDNSKPEDARRQSAAARVLKQLTDCLGDDARLQEPLKGLRSEATGEHRPIFDLQRGERLPSRTREQLEKLLERDGDYVEITAEGSSSLKRGYAEAAKLMLDREKLLQLKEAGCPPLRIQGHVARIRVHKLLPEAAPLNHDASEIEVTDEASGARLLIRDAKNQSGGVKRTVDIVPPDCFPQAQLNRNLELNLVPAGMDIRVEGFINDTVDGPAGTFADCQIYSSLSHEELCRSFSDSLEAAARGAVKAEELFVTPRDRQARRIVIVDEDSANAYFSPSHPSYITVTDESLRYANKEQNQITGFHETIHRLDHSLHLSASACFSSVFDELKKRGSVLFSGINEKTVRSEIDC